MPKSAVRGPARFLVLLLILGLAGGMTATGAVGSEFDESVVPAMEGSALVEVNVPSRADVDALNNEGWDIAEYLREEDDGTVTVQIDAYREDFVELAKRGYKIQTVIADEATWRERKAERDEIQAGIARALELAENGSVAAFGAERSFVSAFAIAPEVTIQRVDYFENYAGRFLSVEAHTPNSTATGGATLALSWNTGDATPFGTAVNMGKFVDTDPTPDVYMYHRHLVRIGALGSVTPARPTMVRVASSAGGVSEAPVNDWIPAGFPAQPPLPNKVVIGANTYYAEGAAFGPAPSVAGVSGVLSIANGPSAVPDSTPANGCGPFVGFPVGGIAIVDRGPANCTFVLKVANAQAAGAVAVIVVNNVAGAPINMGGTDPTITIPAIHVSMPDGDAIKAAAGQTGTVSRAIAASPFPETFQNHFFSSYMDPTQIQGALDATAAQYDHIVDVINLPNITPGYQRPAAAIMNGTGGIGTAPNAAGQNGAVVLWSQVMGHLGGEQLRAQFANPGAPNSPLSIAVTGPNPLGGSDIVVSLATDGAGALTSTAAQVVAAINADPAASALVRATVWATNAGAGVVAARALVALDDFLNAPAHVQRGPFQSKAYRIRNEASTSPKVGVLLFCQQHAREWVTPITCYETAERLIRNYGTDPLTTELVDNLDIFIFPSVNPDGSHHSLYDFNSQRRNMVNYCSPTSASSMPSGRNTWGVDLNRNESVGTLFDGYGGASTSCTSDVFAGPFEQSEPEIRNLNWIQDQNPNIKFSNNIHSSGGYFMWAPGAYINAGRITLPAPNIGIESYFFEAGDLVLNRIKEYRGTVITPQRTGPIADVLYSAAGNSADDAWYRRGAIAYSFEVGADRFTSTTTGTGQSGVGFFPAYASEGQHEAMEFASGNYGLLESALAYARDDEAPTSSTTVCTRPANEILCNEDTFEYSAVDPIDVSFKFGNEPSVIRYTTDGSTPNMSSQSWEAQAPRQPGEIYEFTEPTLVKWFGTDIKGNVGEVREALFIVGTFDNNSGLLGQLAVASSSAKAGSVIPVKFSLGGYFSMMAVVGDPSVQQINCNTGASIGGAFTASGVGATHFRFDAEKGEYIFNWNTDKSFANRCYRVTVQLADQTSLSAVVRFTK